MIDFESMNSLNWLFRRAGHEFALFSHEQLAFFEAFHYGAKLFLSRLGFLAGQKNFLVVLKAVHQEADQEHKKDSSIEHAEDLQGCEDVIKVSDSQPREPGEENFA